MAYLYLVTAFFSTQEEKARANSTKNWQVAPGNDLLQDLLEKSQEAKKEKFRIFVPSKKLDSVGIAEKALSYFQVKHNVREEEIIIQEIQLVGEVLDY